jgi:hypothetical protein
LPFALSFLSYYYRFIYLFYFCLKYLRYFDDSPFPVRPKPTTTNKTVKLHHQPARHSIGIVVRFYYNSKPLAKSSAKVSGSSSNRSKPNQTKPNKDLKSHRRQEQAPHAHTHTLAHQVHALIAFGGSPLTASII